jgi:hypothetical protein
MSGAFFRPPKTDVVCGHDGEEWAFRNCCGYRSCAEKSMRLAMSQDGCVEKSCAQDKRPDLARLFDKTMPKVFSLRAMRTSRGDFRHGVPTTDAIFYSFRARPHHSFSLD